MAVAPTLEELRHELEFTAARSSGAGGQNVNKVNSKVTVRWNIGQSTSITTEQKDIILEKLKNKISDEGALLLTAQEGRSQGQNKEVVLKKLEKLLQNAFKTPRARKPSKPSKASKIKRRESKQKQSEKKQWRKKL